MLQAQKLGDLEDRNSFGNLGFSKVSNGRAAAHTEPITCSFLVNNRWRGLYRRNGLHPHYESPYAFAAGTIRSTASGSTSYTTGVP